MAELSVGEVAERSGVAVSALHFYERKGLIRSHRTGGNQRRFDREVLRRLAIIRMGQDLGVPLAEISEQLEMLPHDRAASKADWAKLSSRWRDRLDRRITLMTRLRDELTGCIGCGCLSLRNCPLYNREDSLAAEGAGPRRLLRSGRDVKALE
ncbi:MAG: redox-sensitive transcriptional activator SoxR [Hyphomicrobiales bacterium]|nr:MAG: redox-sensitive transcriptional activator SoxR [Hyphomicrobiales bacterium]